MFTRRAKALNDNGVMRLWQAAIKQAVLDLTEQGTWVVEVTERSQKLGKHVAVAYAPTIKEAVKLAKVDIIEQRGSQRTNAALPRFQGNPKYTVKAAKLNEEAYDWLFSDASETAYLSCRMWSEAFREDLRRKIEKGLLNNLTTT